MKLSGDNANYLCRSATTDAFLYDGVCTIYTNVGGQVAYSQVASSHRVSPVCAI